MTTQPTREEIEAAKCIFKGTHTKKHRDVMRALADKAGVADLLEAAGAVLVAALASAERDAAQFAALRRKFKAGFFIAGDRDGESTILRYEGRALREIANQILEEERGFDAAQPAQRKDGAV